MKKTLIIIPAFNEELNILKTFKTIESYKKETNETYDVLIVNDGSTDSTEEILQENKIPHILLLKNLGIGGAVQTGYKYALENNYDYAVQLDGDNQHDISFVKTILAPLEKGTADLVIGSRFIGKKNTENFRSSFARRIGIKIISGAIKLKTGKRIFDTTSGFRAANKKVIKMFAEKYPVEYPEPISTTEILLSSGKVAEVPVKMKARNGGKSSISSYKNAYYMINVILLILTSRSLKK